jgi:general secretion pathway protein H
VRSGGQRRHVRDLAGAVPRRPAAGFTLLELLVTLTIVGVVLTIATLSVRGSGEADLNEEIDRLRVLVQLASREAVIEARQLGLQVNDGGYRFFSLEADGWVPIESDRELRERSFPDSIRVRLEIEAADVPLEAPGQSGSPDAPVDAQAPAQVQVLMPSSGEMSDFELSLEERESGATAVLAHTAEAGLIATYTNGRTSAAPREATGER